MLLCHWARGFLQDCTKASGSGLALLLHFGKALAAIHRTVFTGLEGDAGFFAARSARSREHLTGAAGGILAGIAAGFAALGLVFEATAGIKLLLTGGEHELLAAFFAY